MKTVFLIFFVGLVGVRAATYYVDFDSGSDSNNGTSTATTWKHCPGDPLATGNATSLASGDTVVFKGGVNYVLQSTNTTGISLSFSGVTYDGNSAGTWGTGKAILTDQHSTNGHIAFYATTTRSNLTFKNFAIQELGGSADLPTDGGSAIASNPGYGVFFAASAVASSVTIQDCDFSELGYYFNEKPMDSGSIQGNALIFYNAKNLMVTNCNFSRVSSGASLLVSGSGSMTNVTFADCSWTDSIRWCIDIAVTGTNASMDYITIKDCVFHDYHQFDGTNWSGYGEWPHTDGIFLRADYKGGTWGTNINIYNNLFSQTNAVAGGTASIYITEGPSANVFNNVFYYQGKTRAISLAGGPLESGSPQILRIYNNTFVDSTTHMDWGKSISPVVSGYGSLLSVLNNIFVDTRTNSANNFIFYAAATNSAIQTNMMFDYNLYQTRNLLSNFVWWVGILGEAKLTNLQNTLGWETHGQARDAQFLNVSDLNLSPASSASNAGTNLSAYFTTDFTGAIRPATGPWDIGAYELDAESAPETDTTAPSIAVTSPSSTNRWHVTLTGTAADNVGVDHVTVTVNGVSLGNATGTTTWSIAANLREGPNAVVATAYDAVPNYIQTNVTIYFVPNPRVSLNGIRAVGGQLRSN